MNGTFEHDSTEQSTPENLSMGGKIMRSIHAICAKFSRRSPTVLNTENTLPVLLDASDSKAFEAAQQVFAQHPFVHYVRNQEVGRNAILQNFASYGIQFLCENLEPISTSSIEDVRIRNNTVIVRTHSGTIYTIILRSDS